MLEQTIKCPYCKKDIPLTEALTHQIQEKVRSELEIEVRKKEQGLEEREKELSQKIKAVENSQKTIDEEVMKRVDIEKGKLEQEARKKVEEKLSLEMKDLQEQIEEKDKKIEESQQKELELRKRQREIEEKEKSFELEMRRKLDSERKIFEEEISKRITEEQGLKILEKEKTIESLRSQINELKRRVEQGSQQLQGEVQELDLEAFLKDKFTLDNIQPIGKGVRGADVLQEVYTQKGAFCGAILWESKRTKNWSEGWITKLKDDQREAKADFAVFVTEALPKDIPNFGPRNWVWITKPTFISGVATLLRSTLIRVAQIKMATESKDEKMEALFKYLTGPEFTQRMQAIVETFNSMKSDLDKEKRLTITRWAKREKDLERAITAIAVTHGDLQGLTGSSMQPIPALESGEGEIDDDKENNKGNENSEDEDVNIKDIPF